MKDKPPEPATTDVQIKGHVADEHDGREVREVTIGRIASAGKWVELWWAECWTKGGWRTFDNSFKWDELEQGFASGRSEAEMDEIHNYRLNHGYTGFRVTLQSGFPEGERITRVDWPVHVAEDRAFAATDSIEEPAR